MHFAAARRDKVSARHVTAHVFHVVPHDFHDFSHAQKGFAHAACVKCPDIHVRIRANGITTRAAIVNLNGKYVVCHVNCVTARATEISANVSEDFLRVSMAKFCAIEIFTL